jgi:hypothetical protein
MGPMELMGRVGRLVDRAIDNGTIRNGMVIKGMIGDGTWDV